MILGSVASNISGREPSKLCHLSVKDVSNVAHNVQALSLVKTIPYQN
jgi:hypothetical protein